MRMEFLGEASGQFILSTSFRVRGTVEEEPYHCIGTNIARKLYHDARAASTASCRFLLLVEDTALSISKTDAYFSITSARKVANALHSSSVGVEHSEGVGLFLYDENYSIGNPISLWPSPAGCREALPCGSSRYPAESGDRADIAAVAYWVSSNPKWNSPPFLHPN